MADIKLDILNEKTTLEPSPPSPLDTASIFSLFTMSIFNKLLNLGSKRALTIEDVPLLPKSDNVENSAEAFARCWKHRREAGDKTLVFCCQFHLHHILINLSGSSGLSTLPIRRLSRGQIFRLFFSFSSSDC